MARRTRTITFTAPTDIFYLSFRIGSCTDLSLSGANELDCSRALDFKAENAAQNALKQAQDMDEFQELRDFKTGNSYHAVSWKQAARGQGLYIKVFESYPEQNKIEICYEHMPSSEHEEKLSLMMGLVDQCEQQQCPYRLVLPQDELATGSGEAQFQKAQNYWRRLNHVKSTCSWRHAAGSRADLAGTTGFHSYNEQPSICLCNNKLGMAIS